MIKLILIDVDGVMTNGTKLYDSNHDVIAKSFCDLDFTAIKRFKAAGINVCLVSGDEFNKKMAEKRNIDFAFSKEKEKVLVDLLTKYKAATNETVFIGDDIFDLKIMKKCNFRFCPKNSPNIVKNISKVINCLGGEGVVAKVFDYLEESNIIPKVYIEDISSLHS